MLTSSNYISGVLTIHAPDLHHRNVAERRICCHMAAFHGVLKKLETGVCERTTGKRPNDLENIVFRPAFALKVRPKGFEAFGAISFFGLENMTIL